MKYLIVFALCAITFAFADEYAEIRAACLTENNLNKDDLRNEDKVKNTCYYECLYKRLGMMRQDGTFDIDDMVGEDATPERRVEGTKEINDAVKECKARVGTNICKLTHCVHTILAN